MREAAGRIFTRIDLHEVIMQDAEIDAFTFESRISFRYEYRPAGRDLQSRLPRDFLCFDRCTGVDGSMIT
jgi:hypothetical protein